MLVHQNHGARGENGSIMVGMFVCLCLASQKPSEREFFVPAGTHLGVKLLRQEQLKRDPEAVVRDKADKKTGASI